jgi:putative flippase GtrA
MGKLLHGFERVLIAIIAWLLDHAPLPRRFRDAVRGKRQVLSEMVKFSVAGAAATVMFVVTFNALLLTIHDRLDTWAVSLIANVPAITVSYLVSSTFVFARKSGKARHTEIAMFFAFAFVAIAIQLFALNAVEGILGRKLSVLLANAVVFGATVFSWTMRFVTARFVIFKSHLERPAIDLPTELAHLAEEVDEGAIS